MARMRTIKPGFFTNDALADIAPIGRLLFIGLWCIADREGRLEDRPRRIKAEVLPYDDADVDELLDDLMQAGFIQRYIIGPDRYIAITNFSKHQTPHIKEAESAIPAPPTVTPANGPAWCEHRASTVLTPDQHHTSPSDPVTDPVMGRGIQQQIQTAKEQIDPPVQAPVRPAPPPPPDAESIESIAEYIGTLSGSPPEGWIGFVRNWEPKCKAAGLDMSDQAFEWYDKYTRKGISLSVTSFRKWLEREISPDRPPRGAPPPAQAPRTFGAVKPVPGQVKADTTPRRADPIDWKIA